MLTDQELFDILGFPVGNGKVVDDVFNVTRQTLATWLKSSTTRDSEKLPFLNVDRLMMLHRYFKEKQDQRATQHIEKEILDRYSDLTDIVHTPAISLLGPDVEFSEAWFITSQPLELVDPGFAQKNMSKYLDDSESRLVYFVADTNTADKLIGSFQNICDNLRNVQIVVSPVVSLIPHWIILFQDNPSGAGPQIDAHVAVVGKSETGFAKLDPQWARQFIDKISRGGLVRNNRFNWPSEDSRLVSIEGLPAFQLHFP